MAVRIRCGICVVQVSVVRPRGRIERRMRGARFERRRVLPVRARVEANAPRAPASAASKSGGLELAVDHDIAGSLVMDARRIRPQRVVRVDDRRQFGDLDVNAIGEIFGFGGVGATTAAIGSPTKRTTSSARSGCSIG